MADLIDMADALQVDLIAYAEPDPEQQSVASLVRWYSRFGFAPTGPIRHGRQRIERTRSI